MGVMNEKQYVVTYVVSQQITECNWTPNNIAMIVFPYTTVAEIAEFYRIHGGGGSIMDVKITELQK
jgi:hypothetical protein